MPNPKTINQPYNPQVLEPKWLADWEHQALFQQSETSLDQVDGKSPNTEDKLYLLFAFAYPSGSGLHVGHVESKTALDILARFNRMNGKKVFFPVGWDAFGLPAENYAIKTGIPPAVTTKNAINTFRGQIKRLAISYDWANEIATNHPEYYTWTQWLFLELYSKGLAYRGLGMVNWCPEDQTVLANEQVVDGACERCGTKVVQKNLEQWYFKITQYQDELISGLDEVDWPEATKQQQLHWIGKSEGAEVKFKILAGGQETPEDLTVFTTAHDTIYGCTFMVVAPEHALLSAVKEKITNQAEVQAYIEATKAKTELDRQIQKEKTGVQVQGIEAINPANGEKVPVFVADYVLAGYGTGAIMAVPGHDERDHTFAQKYNISIRQVAKPTQVTTTHAETSLIDYPTIKENRHTYVLINSGEWNGLNFEEGREKILAALTAKGVAEAKNHYKLRDWLISRQRYWGAPIPIVYDPEGNAHPVKAEHLPWTLPTDVDFKPTGESPLRSSKEFIARTEKLYGKGWRPEFDTMDTFVDSSWYYLRYVDSRNPEAFARKERLQSWLPVDFYMIGPEHIVLHLLYSRFFTKFLRDQGYLSFGEPFKKMRHQGMILGPDGRKMSKSKGNVINPDEIITKFGADTLRVYEMFMGPIEADKPWDIRAVAGVYRFLTRTYNLVTSAVSQEADKVAGEKSVISPEAEKAILSLKRKFHQTLKKVADDIPKLKYNTAIAVMMELVNEWEKTVQTAKSEGAAVFSKTELAAFIKLIAPFAPFAAEELWHLAEGEEAASVHLQAWPKHDEAMAQAESLIIPIQINGKVRGQLEVSTEESQNQTLVLAQAKELEKIQTWLQGKEIIKEIYVPGKIVNLVVR